MATGDQDTIDISIPNPAAIAQDAQAAELAAEDAEATRTGGEHSQKGTIPPEESVSGILAQVLDEGGGAVKEEFSPYQGVHAVVVAEDGTERVLWKIDSAGAESYLAGQSDSGGGNTGGDMPSESAPAWPAPTRFVAALVAGQSNAQGQGDSALSPDVGQGVAYESTDSGLIHLDDPVGGAGDGSSWPAYALSLHRRAGLGTVLADASVSGAAMHYDARSRGGHWDTRQSGNHYANVLLPSIQRVRSQAQAEDISLSHMVVLWTQGERDAQAIDAGDITVQQYEDAFSALLDQLANDEPGVTLYLTQTGQPRSGDTQGWQDVREAQVRVCRSRANARLTHDRAKTFPQRGLMRDEVHWNQAALSEVGRAYARVVALEKSHS